MQTATEYGASIDNFTWRQRRLSDPVPNGTQPTKNQATHALTHRATHETTNE